MKNNIMFNLRKQRKIALAPLRDIGVQPIDVNRAVDRNSLDWQVAVKNVLSMNPEYQDIDKYMSDKKLTEQQIIDRGMNVDSEQLNDAAQQVERTEDAVTQIISSTQKENKMKAGKVFNLKNKKAQYQNPTAAPGMIDDYNNNPDYAELGEKDYSEMKENQKTFNSHEDLKDWLLQYASIDNPFDEVWQALQAESPSYPDQLRDSIKNFFRDLENKSPEQVLTDAMSVYDYLYGKGQEVVTLEAPRVKVQESTEYIRKIAEKYVKNNKPFNLKKTAQHKTQENMILYGPQQHRKVDPFLRQPVSDWHIVERNKGFGLVVDDVWNIDWETLWRENIMDKYSRPYKNRDGEWVGGYLNKRFEIDRNIPETNNMQLKPGERRKPILPEYGNIESRLQTARSNGNIAGSEDNSKPFNWKEANSKKKIISQIKDMDGIKPFKFPGDPDPTDPETTCVFCGSQVSSTETICPNCGRTDFNVGKPCERKPDDKGKQFNPYSIPTGVMVQKNIPLPKSAQMMPDLGSGSPIGGMTPPPPPKKLKRHKDRADIDEGTAKDTHVSDEISQCTDPFEKNRKNDDSNRRNEIMEITKSCDDLAIDG